MDSTPHPDARILIVDDEAANIELLRHMLEPLGYRRIQGTTDPTEVVDLCEEDPPDLLLLDLKMEPMDGFQVLRRLRADVPDFPHLPVIVLTSDQSREAKVRALSGGARDFLTKPASPVEVRLRVANHLETHFLQLALRDQSERLAERVRKRTRDLEEAQYEILERLARAAEYHDDATGKHTKRVGVRSALVAMALDWPTERVELMRGAAPLHDVGKIGIPTSILLKPGPLSPDEFEKVKEHVTIGRDILSGSRFPVLKLATEIALYHHENWDGSGYRAGLAGDEIPMSARIVAVTDVFDSLTHRRAYKEAWPEERALEEIASLRGTKFDPRVVDAFFETLSEPGAERRDRPRRPPAVGRETAETPYPAGASVGSVEAP